MGGGRGEGTKGRREGSSGPGSERARAARQSVEFMVFFWAHRDDPPAHPRERATLFCVHFLYHANGDTFVVCCRCLSLLTVELFLFPVVGIHTLPHPSSFRYQMQTRPRFSLSTKN